MIAINELRKLNPQAWTSLLTQDAGRGRETDPAVKQRQSSLLVTAVERETADRETNSVRYILSLDGYLEPIALLGKETNVPESLFYANIATRISELSPHCWLCHLEGQEGWIILEESFNDFAPVEWDALDIERIIDRFSLLHAALWERNEELEQIGFTPLIGGKDPELDRLLPVKDAESFLQPLKLSKRIADWDRGDLALPSEHALDSAGNLALDLIQSAISLEKIAELGGWRGVFEDNHGQAAADLLDDPLPFIYPLSQLPASLIHGQPGSNSWSIDLLDNYHLTNWRSAKIGPSVYDLVYFIENFDLTKNSEGATNLRSVWPISEETILDSYILAMGRRLGSRFNSVLTRQAVSAAQCLYFLTVEIPRVAKWMEKNDGEPNWRALENSEKGGLSELEIAEKKIYESHWSNAFTRFLSAYRSL